MYREFLIETSMKTTIFHTDSDITLDILKKEYPDSEIKLIGSGGTKMSTKKSPKCVEKKATIKPGESRQIKDVAPKNSATVKPSKKTRRQRFDKETQDKIVEDYKNHMTYKDLANKYQSSRGSVYNVIVRNGIIHQQKRKK